MIKRWKAVGLNWNRKVPWKKRTNEMPVIDLMSSRLTARWLAALASLSVHGPVNVRGYDSVDWSIHSRSLFRLYRQARTPTSFVIFKPKPNLACNIVKSVYPI
jgi:hypothetical protein